MGTGDRDNRTTDEHRPSELETVARPADEIGGALQSATVVASSSASQDDTLLAASQNVASSDVGATLPGRSASANASSPSRPSNDVDAHAVAAGRTVGRYVVVDRLGAGAMGVVWAAYDPQLDRKVALKLLHPDVAAGDGSRDRLLREAQALARLSHPNVVGIYDTGTLGQQVWISMEFVDGQTLTNWLDRDQHPAGRSWREVMEVMCQAGDGLAAAHAADLVHRDFKPDNVMIGVDGRVRVMDLGLARSFDASGHTIDTVRIGANAGVRDARMAAIEQAATAAHAIDGDATIDAASGADASPTVGAGLGRDATTSVEAATYGSGGGRSSRVDEQLTVAGALVGTPAYMAPEQLAGTIVDGRTDQFAFCVTFWEAVYGQRPFQGEAISDLFGAILEGRRVPPPHRGVPAWLHRTLERGLSTEPDARYPSINALVADLRDGRFRVRVRRGAVATLGLVACVAGGLGLSHLNTLAAQRACDDLGADVVAIWPGRDGRRRAAVREAVLGSGLGYADSTWEHLEPTLDDYAARWAKSRTEACRTSTVTAELDEALRLRSEVCLHDRAQRFEARVEALETGTEPSIANAIDGVHGLSPPEPCTDAQFLRHMPAAPDDPGLLEQVRELRRRIAEADAAAYLGEYDRGLELASTVLESEVARRWDPLRVDALLTMAQLEDDSDRNDQAKAHYVEALHLASDAGDDISAAHAATMLVYVTAMAQGDPSAGEAWAETARMLVRRAELQDSPNLGAGLLLNLGTLALAKGELEEAERHTRAGLEIRTESYGPDHPSLVSAHANLASVLRNAGKYEAAEKQARRAVEIQKRTRGEDHPDVGLSLHNLAASLYEQGRFAESRKIMDQVLENQTAAFGHTSERVGVSLMGLAALAQADGDHEAAQKHASEAAAIFEEVLGPEHVRVAEALDTLGNNHLTLQRDELAMDAYRRAVEIKTKAYGSDHIEVAQTLGSMADVARYADRLDEAEALYDKVLAIQEAKLAPDNPELAYALVGKGAVMGAQGNHTGAVERLTRAVELRVSSKTAPALIAEAELLLAEELWEGGRRTEGIETARSAVARYEDLDDERSRSAADDARAWLTRHGAD